MSAIKDAAAFSKAGQSKLQKLSFIELLCFSRSLFDSVFSFCCPITIIRFGRTNKAGYLAVQSFFTRAYDVNRHLSRFFHDPRAFRRMQQETGTLISGPNAVQFMDRSLFADADLDLYVDRHGCATTGDKFPSDDNYSSYDGRGGMKDVYTFYSRETDSSKHPLKVQIITAHSTSIAVILQFHSTCIMNLISHEHAYSLYPRATFVRRQSLVLYNPYDPDPALCKARGKWSSRGWTMVAWRDADQEGIDSTFCIGERYIGDNKTWCIPLNLDGLDLSPGSGDHLSIHSWRLHGSSVGAPICFNVVRSAVLRNNYTFSEEREAVFPLLKPVLLTFEAAQSQHRRDYISTDPSIRFDYILEELLKMHRELTQKQAQCLVCDSTADLKQYVSDTLKCSYL